MKSIVSLVLILVVCLSGVFASIELDQADVAYEKDAFEQTQSLLLEQLDKATTAEDKAQVLWRLARVLVNLGDELEDNDKDGKYAIYEKGEAYALASIDANPTAMAYLWKASNVGRWGQTKGPLNALGKAKGMLEDLTLVVNSFNTLDSSETWYVLSSLYDELPGGFISFGNKDWAVSYMRMALDTIPSHLLYPGHYKKMAEELYERNWSASKRSKEMRKMEAQWKKATNNLEKYRYYEGKDGGATRPFYSSVTLDRMSDRQEAVMVLSYILDKYKVFSPIKDNDTQEIKEIEVLRNSWV